MADEDPFEEEMERQRKREEKERGKEAAEKATDANGDGYVRNEPVRVGDMDVPQPDQRQPATSS